MKKKLNEDQVLNELTQGSVYFRGRQSPTPQKAEQQKSIQKAKKQKKRSKSRRSELPKLASSKVTDKHTSEPMKLQSYELPNFDKLRRLDIRLTWEQKRFLDNLEEDIRQSMPEGERGNPNHRRITKNSIIRVVIEIIKQLELTVDSSHFRNEGDLLTAIFEALEKKVTELRTSEVSK